MTLPSVLHTVLLTGASGFIGRHLVIALRQAGYFVLSGLSPRSYAKAEFRSKGFTKYHFDKRFHTYLPFDFAKDSEDDWHQRLYERRQRPIDIVINAAGEHVLKLAENAPFSAAVLRPSIIFGKGGASSRLLMNLAKLPLLCLPDPVLNARVQPLAVTDLIQAIITLVKSEQSGIIECAGPEPLHLAEFIASLRQQLGRKPAYTLRLPDWLTRLSARMGDAVPFSPWCSEALALLAKDNVADPAALRDVLGREAIHHSRLLESVWTQDR